MHRRFLYAFCAILAAASVRGATTPFSVPNTFVAGTPAKAEDVNANFTAVANAINALQTAQSAAGPIIVEDSAGHVVGPYIPFGNPVAGSTSDLLQGVFIRTPAASFVAQIYVTGFVSGGSLLYTTSDCTGTAYITSQNGAQSIILNYAIVLNGTAYVLQWAATTTVSVASSASLNGSSLQCTPATPAPQSAAPVIATVDLTTLGFVPPFSLH
jgi:hypothetical protein